MTRFIPCQNCGARPVEEFLYGEIPQVPDTLTDPAQRDLDRVFMRSNPTDEAREAWFHASGCRRWSYLRRHRTSGEWR